MSYTPLTTIAARDLPRHIPWHKSVAKLTTCNKSILKHTQINTRLVLQRNIYITVCDLLRWHSLLSENTRAISVKRLLTLNKQEFVYTKRSKHELHILFRWGFVSNKHGSSGTLLCVCVFGGGVYLATKRNIKLFLFAKIVRLFVCLFACYKINCSERQMGSFAHK